MKKTFSEKIRFLRNKMNLNQYEFSTLIGIKQPTLSTYERGTSYPSLEVLISIAEKCNVSIDWLCGLETVPRFYTVADIILALKELNDLNGFEYNLDISKIDLATYHSYECKITLNSDVHKLWNVDNNTLGNLLEFINDWKETTQDLNSLKNEDIKKNYEQMWWEKQLAHYSTIPVKTKKEANEEYTQKVLDNFESQGLLGELKLGEE